MVFQILHYPSQTYKVFKNKTNCDTIIVVKPMTINYRRYEKERR